MDSSIATSLGALGVLMYFFSLISCPVLAAAKGYSSMVALSVAIFFGPIAMLHYAGLPDTKPRQVR